MNKRQSPHSRIQPRILVLFLILGIPPLVVAHLLLAADAENRFREVVGTYFGQTAQRLQQELVHHIESGEIQLANLTAIPQIEEAVRDSNRRAPDQQTFQTKMREIDFAWPEMTPGNSKLLAGVLDNPASTFLREQNRVTATFREILVSDRYGRLVATTGKTTDYFQGDEPWWRMAYLEGKGQRYISDIVYDESTGVYSIEIAQPVRDGASGETAGILKGIVDAHTMFGLLDHLDFGRDATAVVLRRDGTMVTSPASDEPYPYAAALFDGLSKNRRWAEVPEARPGFFVGLPETGLNSSIPELDWVVIVEAPYAEVFAPFTYLKSRFLYIALMSIALVIVMSIVFSWILSRPIIETDPHLERV